MLSNRIPLGFVRFGGSLNLLYVGDDPNRAEDLLEEAKCGDQFSEPS